MYRTKKFAIYLLNSYAAAATAAAADSFLI
jgi:hypothetical protein